MKNTYKFKTILWLYPGMAGWYFVTLPNDMTEQIDMQFSIYKKGWGSMPVSVTIGETAWDTSIFPDKKEQSYLLPIKKDVRKKESIKEGDSVTVTLSIRADK